MISWAHIDHSQVNTLQVNMALLKLKQYYKWYFLLTIVYWVLLSIIL